MKKRFIFKNFVKSLLCLAFFAGCESTETNNVVRNQPEKRTLEVNLLEEDEKTKDDLTETEVVAEPEGESETEVDWILDPIPGVVLEKYSRGNYDIEVKYLNYIAYLSSDSKLYEYYFKENNRILDIYYSPEERIVMGHLQPYVYFIISKYRIDTEITTGKQRCWLKIEQKISDDLIYDGWMNITDFGMDDYLAITEPVKRTFSKGLTSFGSYCYPTDWVFYTNKEITLIDVPFKFYDCVGSIPAADDDKQTKLSVLWYIPEKGRRKDSYDYEQSYIYVECEKDGRTYTGWTLMDSLSEEYKDFRRREAASKK